MTRKWTIYCHTIKLKGQNHGLVNKKKMVTKLIKDKRKENKKKGKLGPREEDSQGVTPKKQKEVFRRSSVDDEIGIGRGP